MGKIDRKLEMNIHNKFDIEVIDANTGIVKQRAHAFNVICNTYFDRLGNGSMSSIVYGSGTGTPSASDSALFHYEGTASDSSTYSPYDTIDRSHEYEGIWVRRIKRTIPNTESVGVSITEVGFGSSSYLYTHAMLQDMNGNPISIAKTDTDIINIYCSLYLHYSGQSGDVHLYNVEVADASIIKFALHKGANTNTICHSLLLGRYCIGNANRDATAASRTYSSATRTLSVQMNQVPVANGNVGGAFGISFTGSNQNAITAHIIIEGGGTVIPPASIVGESIGVGDGSTTKFKTKFGCPYNATVKINGVAQQSGVTVKKMPSVTYRDPSVSVDYSLTSGSDYFSTFFRWVFKDDLSLIATGSHENAGWSNDEITSIPIDGLSVLEVLYPQVVGITNISFYYAEYSRTVIEASYDGISWDVVPRSGNNYVPAHTDYKYFRVASEWNINNNIPSLRVPSYDPNNVIFDTPPAQGDVITIDYTTDLIPKDEDHVLDVSLTMQFGEYQGQ